MKYPAIILLIALLGSPSYGQKDSTAIADSISYAEQFEALYAEMDSLSIFMLFDSLLALEKIRFSELVPRIGYNSDVVSAGRTYGISQHGLSPGLSYYHSSGFFADYTGFWNSQTDPKYALSVFSLGYLTSLSDQVTLTATGEKWLYHQSDDQSLSNSLGLTTNWNSKIGFATLDYSFLFGESTAHRIIGGFTGKINLRKTWIFDEIQILPSANVLFGNEDITLYRFREDTRTQQLLFLTQLTQRDILRLLQQGQITRDEARQMERTRRLLTSDQLTEEQEARLTELLYDIKEENVFGLMNYSFSLPIMASTGSFNFLLSYIYSVPVKLPGEDISLEPTGYIGASVGYRIPFSH